MKLLQDATITIPDTYLDQDSYEHAKVVKNGSKITISIPRVDVDQKSGRRTPRPDLRLDRITNSTWTEKPGKEVVITGRSEYLREMGARLEDQQVTILAKGGECENCRGVKS